MIPLYVHKGNVEAIVGITAHALEQLAKRHKLASVVECRRRLWHTAEVLAAIEKDRATAATFDAKRALEASGLKRAG